VSSRRDQSRCTFGSPRRFAAEQSAWVAHFSAVIAKPVEIIDAAPRNVRRRTDLRALGI
jgi:hypothetical protein